MLPNTLSVTVSPVHSIQGPERKIHRFNWLQILLIVLIVAIAASLSFAFLLQGYCRDLGIEVIRLEGTIVTGNYHDGEYVGSEYIGRQLRNAADDPMVDAIVLRVNSPGGTPAAAQEIIRDMEYARAKKPVVVSMGDIATSSAYYVSAYADQIYADPDTITGGIGTAWIFIDFSGWLDEENISVEVLKSGSKKDMSSGYRPLSEEEREYAGRLVNESYERFIDDISSQREIAVETLGDARVVRGESALGLGLVDRIGNLNDAIAGARDLAG